MAIDETPKDLKKMTVHELMTEANYLLRKSQESIDKIEKSIKTLAEAYAHHLPFTRKLAARLQSKKRSPQRGRK